MHDGCGTLPAIRGLIFRQAADHGHSGIDFGSGADASVVVMVGGEVIGVEPNRAAGSGSSGNHVRIRSCTNPDSNSGVVHICLHPDEVYVVRNQHVKKGQQIGPSGNTGGVAARLHVHPAPFAGEGTIVGGDSNSEKLDPPHRDWDLGNLLQPPVRVKGA